MDDRQRAVHDARLRLLKEPAVAVRVARPARAVQPQPVDVDAVLGPRLDLGRVAVRRHTEPEAQRIDRDRVLARVHLKHAGHEALREEEARQPEAARQPVLQPAAHERDARVVVLDPGRERLERRVRPARPQLGHLVVEHRVVHGLQLGAHHHQALERLLQLRQRAGHGGGQAVEAVHLLAQHHAQRVELPRLGAVEQSVRRLLARQHLGQLSHQVGRHLAHDVIAALATRAARHARLDGQDCLHQPPRLLQLERDVGVGVHAKHLGRLGDGQLPQVLAV
mmetsp:Transcript_18745/g.47533  ORF Transcript_18745/g.47533 Transcript_18745/m.47533 type:complete len:280 (+) Transcript_18745:541-1380(+)